MSGEELRTSTALTRAVQAIREYRDNQWDLEARVVAGELLTIVEDITDEAQDPDPRDRADDRGAEPVDREQRGVRRGDQAADLRRGPLDEVAPSAPEPSGLARDAAAWKAMGGEGQYQPPEPQNQPEPRLCRPCRAGYHLHLPHRCGVSDCSCPSTPEPSGWSRATAKGTAIDVDEWNRPLYVRAAPSTEPALDDPLMLTSGWTITITEHSDGGYYEPPSQHVSVEWSSPDVNPIRVNELTIEDALLAIRSQLSALYGRFADHEDGPRTPVSG